MGWKSYAGGFNPYSEDQKTYYASWRGVEIIYHVSTLLNASSQRVCCLDFISILNNFFHFFKKKRKQHIGNDHVLIFFKEPNGPPIKAMFRGDVNSIAFVVEPQYDEIKKELLLGWRVECFWRKRITHWEPLLSPHFITKSKTLRDFILANGLHS